MSLKIGTMQQEVKVKDWEFLWEKRNFRRSVSIVLRPGQRLKVISSKSLSLDVILGFLEEKRSWIEKQKNKLENYSQKKEKNFLQGEEFLYLGKALPLQIKPTALERAFVNVSEDGLNIYYPIGVQLSTEQRAQLLQDFYERQGRLYLQRRAQELCYQLQMQEPDLVVAQIKIKGQSTRWGSCTSAGVIALNWKLIAFSELAIDYVIIHEMAHLKHLNHGPGFWALVEKLCPQFKVAKRELRHQSLHVDFLN